jgi:hypothetical protein
MELVTGVIIAVAAVSLFGVGIRLLLIGGSAATALTFAFLLTVLLLLSKFKRFKGFGFEAEMWEQKQEEAAALINHLKGLSKVASRQTASLAARVGLWNSALSLAELADCLRDLQGQLAEIGISSHEREEILQTLYNRIEAAYVEAGYALVRKAFAGDHETIEKSRSTNVVAAAAMNPKLNEEGQALSLLDPITIERLREFVRDSEILQSKHKLLQELADIDRDLGHFRLNRSFRRRATG